MYSNHQKDDADIALMHSCAPASNHRERPAPGTPASSADDAGQMVSALVYDGAVILLKRHSDLN